jgi:hypothetical protein
MRKVGVVVVWFCLGVGMTELVVLSMQQVVISARLPQQMMAHAAPHPGLTRTDLVWRISRTP